MGRAQLVTKKSAWAGVGTLIVPMQRGHPGVLAIVEMQCSTDRELSKEQPGSRHVLITVFIGQPAWRGANTRRTAPGCVGVTITKFATQALATVRICNARQVLPKTPQTLPSTSPHARKYAKVANLVENVLKRAIA